MSADAQVFPLLQSAVMTCIDVCCKDDSSFCQILDKALHWLHQRAEYKVNTGPSGGQYLLCKTLSSPKPCDVEHTHTKTMNMNVGAIIGTATGVRTGRRYPPFPPSFPTFRPTARRWSTPPIHPQSNDTTGSHSY